MKSGSDNYLRSMKKMAVFASGAGTNTQKIIDHFSDKNKKAEIALIVCNNPAAGVLNIAAKEHIPALILEKEQFFRGDAYVPELKNAQIDLIVLAGFLWKIPQRLIDAYPERIINIHPALLPRYGGKGMYGSFVHEAVLNAGGTESGITIHYVNEHYDQGNIIFQTRCPVDTTDNIHSLSEKIHQLEHQYYPIVIEEVLNKTGTGS